MWVGREKGAGKGQGELLPECKGGVSPGSGEGATGRKRSKVVEGSLPRPRLKCQHPLGAYKAPSFLSSPTNWQVDAALSCSEPMYQSRRLRVQQGEV